jgi:hypothetical protein
MLRQTLAKITPLRRAYYWASARGQFDEGEILLRLTTETNAPRNFVEFGFHPREFNCAALMRRGWSGLLIDGNARQVADARALLPSRIRCEHLFLTRDNLDIVRNAFPALGVLSIDIDGNDYWVMERLIGIRPSVIAVEYNASFLNESVTIPYEPDFDRHRAHESGWYHGASLVALTRLAAAHGYGLAAVSAGGANAFFTESGDLDPLAAWRANTLRDKWSSTTPAEQWRRIKHLPLTSV